MTLRFPPRSVATNTPTPADGLPALPVGPPLRGSRLSLALAGLVACLPLSAAEPKTANPPTTLPPDWRPRAERVLGAMVSGTLADIPTSFGPTLAAALPADRLAALWESLQSQMGPYRRSAGWRAEPIRDWTVASVACEFSRGTLDLQLAFDAEGRVEGLHFAPARWPGSYRSPAYVKAAAFESREFEISDQGHRLEATLCLPNGPGPFPGVLLLRATGPQDRNESWGPNQPYRDLAEGLASRGMAVLRYAVRSERHPAGVAANPELAGLCADTIQDARWALELLRRSENVNPESLFVLGHSLGGLLLPRLAEEEPGLAGFVFLAGPTPPMKVDPSPGDPSPVSPPTITAELDRVAMQAGEVRDYRRRSDPPPMAVELGRIAAGADTVRDLNLALLATDSPAAAAPPAALWLEFSEYRPQSIVSQLRYPLLVLQNNGDFRLFQEEEALLNSTRAKGLDVEFRFSPLPIRLFFEARLLAPSGLAPQPGNLPSAVVETIATWVRARS